MGMSVGGAGRGEGGGGERRGPAGQRGTEQRPLLGSQPQGAGRGVLPQERWAPPPPLEGAGLGGWGQLGEGGPGPRGWCLEQERVAGTLRQVGH